VTPALFGVIGFCIAGEFACLNPKSVWLSSDGAAWLGAVLVGIATGCLAILWAKTADRG